MAGVFKQVQQGLGQCLIKVMIDGGGAVLKFADDEGIEITVYLEYKELQMILDEQKRVTKVMDDTNAMMKTLKKGK